MTLGDYIRTKYGIAKIIGEKGNYFVLDNNVIYNNSDGYISSILYKDCIYEERQITKHSNNLIDIIKIGDLVNKSVVLDNYIDKEGNKKLKIHCTREYITEEEVNNSWIVTAEQYEYIAYKFGGINENI